MKLPPFVPSELIRPIVLGQVCALLRQFTTGTVDRTLRDVASQVYLARQTFEGDDEGFTSALVVHHRGLKVDDRGTAWVPAQARHMGGVVHTEKFWVGWYLVGYPEPRVSAWDPIPGE